MYKLYRNLNLRKDEISVNRLVYRLHSSKPFTGRLEIKNPPHTAYYNFCEGMPCGAWVYKFNGDVVHKGQYLNKEKISEEVIALLSKDTFAISSWQEGQLSTDPRFLTLEILKPDSFFLRNKTAYKEYANSMAITIFNHERIETYDRLIIDFESDFYNPRKSMEIEFKIYKGRIYLQ